MHSVGGQRYCSRSLASASRGLPVLGRVQVCSQRRAQTSTLPTPAAPSAGLKQEQRQWSAAVESQLLKWGVEDQTTANDLLVALRAAGLNRPLNFAVATVLSDVIPQLLATAVLGAGAILSFKGGCQAAVAFGHLHATLAAGPCQRSSTQQLRSLCMSPRACPCAAIAWAFMDVSASLLLRFLGGLLGAASGLGFFWPESALGFVKVAGASAGLQLQGQPLQPLILAESIVITVLGLDCGRPYQLLPIC